jgi:hypothetical protein
MLPRYFTPWLVLALSLVALSCGGEDDKPAATPAPSSTPSATTRPATPTPGPAPTATPVRPIKLVGETMRVWVYENAPTAFGDCANRLLFMIPLRAPPDTKGKAIECRITATDQIRLLHTLDDQGVAHLESVDLVLSATRDLPSMSGPARACRDLAPYLLKPPASPSEAAFTLVCTYELPLRTESRSQMEVWGMIPATTERTAGSNNMAPLPPNRRCWELLVYLGGMSEGMTTPVRCILD